MATKMKSLRSYTELSGINDFLERYRYLRLHSSIGIATFGSDRWVNQRFYLSAEWRLIRQEVIARDRGCDLGIEGHEIHDRIAIHHMNPLTLNEVTHGDDSIFDPEFLITVSHRTHNAIHFSDERLLSRPFVARRPGDTKLW
jgi:hypothetical protein